MQIKFENFSVVDIDFPGIYLCFHAIFSPAEVRGLRTYSGYTQTHRQVFNNIVYKIVLRAIYIRLRERDTTNGCREQTRSDRSVNVHHYRARPPRPRMP